MNDEFKGCFHGIRGGRHDRPTPGEIGIVRTAKTWDVAGRIAQAAADRSCRRSGVIATAVIAVAIIFSFLIVATSGYSHGFAVALVAVVAAAWRWGFQAGLAMAVGLGVLTTLWTHLNGIEPSTVIRDNAVFLAIGVCLAVCFAVAGEMLLRLSAADDEIRRLQGLLPICAWCKKIRDDQGAWQHIEEYISSRSDAEFSHSICKQCSTELYGEIGDLEDSHDPA